MTRSPAPTTDARQPGEPAATCSISRRSTDFAEDHVEACLFGREREGRNFFVSTIGTGAARRESGGQNWNWRDGGFGKATPFAIRFDAIRNRAETRIGSAAGVTAEDCHMAFECPDAVELQVRNRASTSGGHFVLSGLIVNGVPIDDADIRVGSDETVTFSITGLPPQAVLSISGTIDSALLGDGFDGARLGLRVRLGAARVRVAGALPAFGVLRAFLRRNARAIAGEPMRGAKRV